MSGKTHISLKTKKILLGTGITFGTILVFIISFFISFSLIINPISFSAIGHDDVAAENEELKSQVQTLEDEIEYLNAAVEKYKNNVNTPVPPATVTTPETATPSQTEGNAPATQSETHNAATDPKPSDGGSNAESGAGEGFIPDTVTTPEDGFEPEVEPDITVIDISD